MDAFVKILPQKKDPTPTLHTKEIQRLEECVKKGLNVFLCGSSGVGKTFILEKVLNNSNSIEIHSELFQRKSTFLDLIGETSFHIFIDGYDVNVYGHRQLMERINSKKEPLTTGSVVFVSNSVHIIPGFELIVVPKRTADEIASLEPGNPRSRLAADKCNGNIRDFYHYINKSDEKDVFKTSKDILIEVLCRRGSFNISQTIHERGHVIDVIHGNYLRSKGSNVEVISESLSLADVYDAEIYKGEWDCVPYYTASGIAVPKYYLGELLKPEEIQPGSTWTKYGNYKMRLQKIQNIQHRNTTKIGIEELQILREYAKAGDFEKCLKYKLEPGDFDVMNHLALHNKIKTNEVMKVKKKMINVINEL
jgi:hypothetical protein